MVAVASKESVLLPLRPHQIPAVTDTVKAVKSGRHVVLDAPTGSGKSVIAAHVAEQMGGRVVYVADEIGLVRQMVGSHPQFYPIYGHGNYCDETWRCYQEKVECSACGSEVSWYGYHLHDKHGYQIEDAARMSVGIDCEYRQTKLIAMGQQYLAMSTQYLITDMIYVGAFSGIEALIIDECDQVQTTADRVFGVDFLYSVLRKWGGVRGVLSKTKKQEVLRDEAMGLLREFVRVVALEIEELRESGKTQGEKVHRLDEQLQRADRGLMLLDADDTVISASGDGFSIRFVDVGPLLAEKVWRNVGRVVAMSATPGDTGTWCRTVGLETGVRVDVPHTFPLENRKVQVLDGPHMSKAGFSDAEKVRAMAAEIMRLTSGERSLVLVASRVQAESLARLLGGRAILHASGQASKDEALDRLRRSADGVVISQSFWRGVDLIGDACRVVVVAKIPWPDWGDPLVQARADRIDGWYAGQTAGKLVQGGGRAVRGPDDWAKIYVLDGSYRQAHGRLLRHLPVWFRQALEMDEVVLPSPRKR